ncbi:MAG: 30S ribosomal protein S4 [Nitrospira sp.]|nr:30S ribosomal protein S4 [bacterium]MBL7049303.1 30S ribosomal protein S4 [Nitrospira sp.]
MARYREALCRLCRRESEKLFLKGDRCYTEKCAVERRKYPPGQHGQRRKKFSDYALQLREKQKAKETYGVLERQFRKYYYIADKQKGVTGSNLLQLLERRLDNVVYRLGIGANRRQARQFVLHGHITVNDKHVNIPSYLIGENDVVSVKVISRKNVLIEENISKIQHRGLPSWVEMDAASFTGKVLHYPARDEIELPVQEQLIIELYSK